MKKNILCMLFGHTYYEGVITFSFQIMSIGKPWETNSREAKTIICKRCGKMPIKPVIHLGATKEPTLMDNFQMEMRKYQW
jgi:hypothetical protein